MRGLKKIVVICVALALTLASSAYGFSPCGQNDDAQPQISMTDDRHSHHDGIAADMDGMMHGQISQGHSLSGDSAPCCDDCIDLCTFLGPAVAPGRVTFSPFDGRAFYVDADALGVSSAIDLLFRPPIVSV